MRYYHKDCEPQLIPTLNLERRHRKRKFSEAWPEIEVQRLQKVRIERRDLREGLRKWRYERAKLEHREREPYKVFVDATLDALVDEMPDTDEQLRRCYGIGQKRANKYGTALLQLIRTYKENHGYSTSSETDDTLPGPAPKEVPNCRTSNERDHHADKTGHYVYIPASPLAMVGNTINSETSQNKETRLKDASTTEDSKRHQEASKCRTSNKRKHHAVKTGHYVYIPASPLAIVGNSIKSESSHKNETSLIDATKNQSFSPPLTTTKDSKRHAPSMEDYDALHHKVSNMSVTCSTDVKPQPIT